MKMLINKNIKLLVVHCSDTADGQNLSALDIHKAPWFWLEWYRISQNY